MGTTFVEMQEVRSWHYFVDGCDEGTNLKKAYETVITQCFDITRGDAEEILSCPEKMIDILKEYLERKRIKEIMEGNR